MIIKLLKINNRRLLPNKKQLSIKDEDILRALRSEYPHFPPLSLMTKNLSICLLMILFDKPYRRKKWRYNC